MKRLCFIFGVVMIMVGCASKPERVLVRSTVIPQPIKKAEVVVGVKSNSSATHQKSLTIIQGKTTKQEIFDVMGQPSSHHIDNDGSESFYYSRFDWDKSHSSIQLKVVTKQGSTYEYLLHKDAKMDSVSITVFNNIVQSISVS